MPGKLRGKRIAMLVANEGVERVEMDEPRTALRDAGAEVELLAPEAGPVRTFDHLDPAAVVEADRAVGTASAADYDALVLPGGVANPDQLRTDSDALTFVRDFFATGRPVAAICHASWTLIDAGVIEGRRLTSWPSLQTDLRNAGAEWVDAEVEIDGALISSRGPQDLEAFNAAIVEAVS